MKKSIAVSLFILITFISLTGCKSETVPKIGVAFGVGPAARWANEIQYMTDYAESLNLQLKTRLNTDEAAKPLAEDCYELIDSGIDVLIVRPRDVHNMKEVVDYAHQKDVKVISYDSLIEKEAVDLFIGYDSENTGMVLGHYLSEMVTNGDYILIWGDTNRNVEDMYDGAMKYLDSLNGQIHIILETGIPGWSSEEAKKAVKEAVSQNGNHVDAILAFNDTLAGACAEALSEMNITESVAITGIDAEISAVQRIVAGTQSCTAYMDLQGLSQAAIDQAVLLAKNDQPETNSEMDNNSGVPIPSYLLARQLVTKLNIDRILIESGVYTREQVYGPLTVQ